MRTTRVLAIVAILGFAFSFRASAKVVYDSETTNTWFNANVKDSSTLASQWTPPQQGGEAVVKGDSNAHYIALDTDLDDPLTYTATDASADVAVVAAEMTATVNATAPQITADPQAALAVIGNGAATNWVGLVGKEGGGTEWVTFPSPIPVIGDSYSVRIEFDQRPGEARRIRYLVDGVVLLGEGSSDGWYPNPQTGTAKISNVSFSGSGDIKALAGENITENTIAFDTPTQTGGYDYTNGTINVSAAIQGYTDVTATLTVTGTDGGDVKVVQRAQSSANWSWDLNDLTQGGVYAYTIEAKDAGGNVIATKTGTFTAAKWPANIWFGADASKSTPADRVKGGSWATEAPQIEGNAYVIEDDALFNVTDQKPGSNHVTRVDTKVTFETLVDSNSLEIPEDVALGGFVAAKNGEIPQWMALTAVNGSSKWVALEGDLVPAVNVPYVIRAEIDFISAENRVRYLASNDDGATFAPLTDGTSQWIPLATQTKYSLAAVELKGSGRVAKFEAKVADKALAVVDGVEYDTMEAALAAAKDNGKAIELLTNATVEPTEKGSYDIAPGTHQYVSGGKVSSVERTIVVTEPGQPPVVRPSETVMEGVETPSGKPYKNINSLREFLERNGVTEYQNENATSGEIAAALEKPGVNTLPLWQDYALGIDPTNSVAPVTKPAGDTDPENITLAIPAIDTTKYSKDYDISYQVMKDTASDPVKTVPDPSAILIPLSNGTGTYMIKAVFTPAN